MDSLKHKVTHASPIKFVAGFTLLELIVGLSIAIILATIAVPSFQSMIVKYRAKNIATEVLSALLRTRSEAVNRNTKVSIIPLSGEWAAGWKILDPKTPAVVIENHEALRSVSMTGPADVSFTNSGRIFGGTVPVFVISAISGSTTVSQCISIDLSGRPYGKEGTSC
jgi:type IV fimbrial biogenesis protein FimT